MGVLVTIKEFAWDIGDVFSRLARECYEITIRSVRDGNGLPDFTIHTPGCPNADRDVSLFSDCGDCVQFRLNGNFPDVA